jgi:trans-aconitate methyltransferase
MYPLGAMDNGPPKIRCRSMREYDSIADWYQTDRSQTFGVAETLGVAAWLRAHSRILDVGCGNGVSITEALVHAGHRLVGLDSSAGMLARFKINLPGTPIVRGDARCPRSQIAASTLRFRGG